MHTGRYSKLQEQYNEAFGTIQEQKQLITQLEEDLRSVNAVSSMFRGDAEVYINILIMIVNNEKSWVETLNKTGPKLLYIGRKPL